MHRGWLALACVVSAIVILWAPFVGEIRSQLRARFPGQFVTIVGSAIAAMAGAAVVAALARIREGRSRRYLALAAALAIAAGYSWWSQTGRPDADVVERFHFIEFGVLTFLFYRAARPAGDVTVLAFPALAGLLVGTLEEWFQWFIPVRVGELRDVFLNGAAIASGLLFACALDPPPSPFTVRAGTLRRLGVWAAVVAVAIASFFDCVHLGYEITDDEAGIFLSRYRAGDLARLAADREASWRLRPPPLEIPRLSREDQYLTEGIEHVMERNRLWSAGDPAGAWHENRILEKYFAPVIDVPSYHSRAGHRWPDAQQQQASAAAAAGRRAYASRSNPAPVYTWPRVAFWAAVASAVGLMLAAAVRLDRQ
jgi:hypothetical protein